MDPKQRLFIYDRKEMGVLILLAVMVALFAFTLGVHLGKRVGPKTLFSQDVHSSTETQTIADEIPDRHELTEQGKLVQGAIDESLSQTLHEEVTRTGIKMDAPRQIELPPNTISSKAKKAEPHAPASRLPLVHSSEETLTEKAIPAALRPAPDGKYTLQVGSYPNLLEARDQAESLEALGMKPYLRSVDLKQKGKWYRVYLGGYPTKDEATQAGNRYKETQAIDSFMVANRAE